MKAFVKVITSLVIFVVVFLFLFSTRHFSLIDSQYYQPSVVSSINSDLEKVVLDFEEWQSDLRKSFKSFSEETVVKRCMSQNQTDGDIALREKTSAELVLSLPSMQGVRIIEKETQRIHFSTFSTDIISKSNTAISYAKYGKNTLDIPYNVIEASSDSNKPCVDVLNNAFIFVQPFYDDYNVERGKIFFYISAKSFARKLVNEKCLSLTEEVNLLTDDNLNFIGILLGLPYQDSSLLKEEVLKEWKIGESDLAQISNKESLSSPFWVLVTYKKLPYYVGRICDKNMFIMPAYARYFLMMVVSLIAFLITFLLLNIRQDRFVVARKKIQKLHANIIVDILRSAESLDDEKLREKIEYKRHDANAEIRKALGKKISQKYENEINAMLEQSWARIIQVVGARADNTDGLIHTNKDDEILKILKEILQQGGIKTKDIPQKIRQVDAEKMKGVGQLNVAVGKEADLSEPVEELEEVEEFEGLDEIGDLESVDDVQDLEEVEDLEEVDELEELPSNNLKGGAATVALATDDVQGLEEVEDLEEVEELEELPSDDDLKNDESTVAVATDDVQGLEEAEDLEEVEELEELPSDDDLKNDESTVAVATDDVQGLEEVEDLEEVEELEELPSDNLKGGVATVAVATDDVQGLEEVQELEEVDAEELPLVSMDGKKTSDDGIEELEEVEDFEEVGIDDFISVDETPPPPRPKFEEVDDYIEPDEELFHSQSEEAEDRFKHISIGGLDFSYLDDKKDDESPSNLLELKNAWVEPPVPDGSPLIGELEVVGDAEPSDVESLEEDAIINKDGIYTISEVEKPEPSDMEFKNLVDSVINEA